MNTVTAQGAPGSVIRQFQEYPQFAVQLLVKSQELVKCIRERWDTSAVPVQRAAYNEAVLGLEEAIGYCPRIPFQDGR